MYPAASHPSDLSHQVKMSVQRNTNLCSMSSRIMIEHDDVMQTCDYLFSERLYVVC